MNAAGAPVKKQSALSVFGTGASLRGNDAGGRASPARPLRPGQELRDVCDYARPHAQMGALHAGGRHHRLVESRGRYSRRGRGSGGHRDHQDHQCVRKPDRRRAAQDHCPAGRDPASGRPDSRDRRSRDPRSGAKRLHRRIPGQLCAAGRRRRDRHGPQAFYCRYPCGRDPRGPGGGGRGRPCGSDPRLCGRSEQLAVQPRGPGGRRAGHRPRPARPWRFQQVRG